ncbi:DUF3429 domain-containing protein [Sphingobium sp. Z007]|uniref:DUF3429 domain-containing protein n=1 Tax=Sphingobium sp. Z007 TaxID=627495 RepID=UPI000B49DBDC|nr:DUF3429 domain-containing protein [Sphingobium sp. Z007]
MHIPSTPRILGLLGLLPQLIAVLLIAAGDMEWRFAALAMAYFYAATILSFLGGLWWGLIAKDDRAPGWIYAAAVVPQLLAFASAWPWAIGAAWPGPSMTVLGIALIASLTVDRRLARLGLTPSWWLMLRTPLSIGLGGLTLIGAWLAGP